MEEVDLFYPVEFQFDTDEVEIFRRDNELVLRKKIQIA